MKRNFDLNESLIDYQELLYIEELVKQQKQLKRIVLSNRIMGRIVKK